MEPPLVCIALAYKHPGAWAPDGGVYSVEGPKALANIVNVIAMVRKAAVKNHFKDLRRNLLMLFILTIPFFLDV